MKSTPQPYSIKFQNISWKNPYYYFYISPIIFPYQLIFFSFVAPWLSLSSQFQTGLKYTSLSLNIIPSSEPFICRTVPASSFSLWIIRGANFWEMNLEFPITAYIRTIKLKWFSFLSSTDLIQFNNNFYFFKLNTLHNLV